MSETFSREQAEASATEFIGTHERYFEGLNPENKNMEWLFKLLPKEIPDSAQFVSQLWVYLSIWALDFLFQKERKPDDSPTLYDALLTAIQSGQLPASEVA